MNKMRFTFSIVPALLLFCACTSPSGKELASRYNAEGKYDAAAHAATEGLRNGEKTPGSIFSGHRHISPRVNGKRLLQMRISP